MGACQQAPYGVVHRILAQGGCALLADERPAARISLGRWRLQAP